MSDNVTIRRLATGVPGLDAVLGGGLPEFAFTLIAGAPGCGKTTLAHQIMFALATPEKPAIYFTALGETALKMFRYQQQFDFFDSSVIGNAIHFVSLNDEILAGDLDQLLRRIVTEVEERGPSLVFVDSFRALARANQEESGGGTRLQHFVDQLGIFMTGFQATTFLIGEYESDNQTTPILGMADGLIWLRQSLQRNSMVRKMEIVKMRGQATLPGLHTFRIGEAGIEVFAPSQIVAEKTARVSLPQESRMRTGISALDGMLGGGLPRGCSVLVAGPSGSGKSILATAFLEEGIRSGETGVVAAFEQPSHRSRNPVLAGLIACGKVGVVDNRAPDLSIDEIVLLLVTEVHRLKATRVVIDSLSGFELALAPTFRDDFRESLARMVTALGALGVTVLMTSELEDRYTDLRFSPYGTAFLTDVIIVQRYIELDSRLRRVIAVVKVRASAHSDELRLFSIDDSGIQIGPTIPDEEGLLGGRRTKKKAHVLPVASASVGHVADSAA